MKDDTISRAAAIDAICEDGTQRERQGQYSMTMVDRKYRDTEILEALPPAQPGWISVTERLPEDAYGCLVTVHYDNYYTGEHDAVYREVVGWDGETWNDWSGLPIDDEVVAWMPLPTPYREGGQDASVRDL